MTESAGNPGAKVGGVPHELRDTAIWLTAVTVFVYFVAERYLTGYLNHYGAEAYWFDVSLPRLLMFSWLGIAYGAVVASILQFVIAFVNSRKLFFIPIYVIHCTINVLYLLSIFWATAKQNGDFNSFSWILLSSFIVLLIIVVVGPLIMRKHKVGYNVLEMVRDEDLHSRYIAAGLIFFIVFIGIPTSAKTIGGIAAAVVNIDSRAFSVADSNGDVPTRILFTDGDRYLIKRTIDENNAEVRFIDQANSVDIRLKSKREIFLDEGRSRLSMNFMKLLAIDLHLIHEAGDSLPTTIDELFEAKPDDSEDASSLQYHLDIWDNPFGFEIDTDGGDYTITSAGPDEVMDSLDDLVLTGNVSTMPELDFDE